MVAAEMVTGIDSSGVRYLVDLPQGLTAQVTGIDSRASQGLARRLAEIGFLPGEKVRVLARIPGGDPVAVRIGTSTFALRRHEASCIEIRAEAHRSGQDE